MKKTIRLLQLALFFCLQTTFASAQIFPDVTPDNIDETVDLIFELHGGMIDTDYNTVYDFLDALLPDNITDPSYDASCAPPDASIDNANSVTISASWNAIPGAYVYESAFLKLNQFPIPETGSSIGPNPDVQFVVSNGLILMAFQTHCAPGRKGRLSIIIEDKPVFFGEMQENCECETPDLPLTQSFGFEAGNAVFPYMHEGIGYYRGTIVNGEVSAEFLIKVELGEEEITISRRSDCMENLFKYGSILYNRKEVDGELGEILGAMTFSSGIVFSPAIGRSGNFTLIRCLSDGTPKSNVTRRENDGFSQSNDDENIKAMPNPARDVVSITLPADLKTENSDCFLIDALGNHIQLSTDLYQYHDGAFDIQIGHLPVGVYSFAIQNKNRIMKTRFIKIQ